MKSPRLAALAAVVLWGVSFVATKAALVEISPITLVFTRFALGTALLFAILALRRRPILMPRETFGSLALMGFVGVFLHQMLQAYGLQRTTAVKTGWLIGLIPIWSAILSALFLGERFGAGRLLGLAIGLAGALLVITRGQMGGDFLRLPSTIGDFLILASTVNWAVYTVIGRETLRRLGSLVSTAWAMLLGWLMFLPLFGIAGGWREWEVLSARGWGAVLFLGIGCSGLGYLFWYGALERIEASRVAAFLYIEPLVTLCAAVLLLGEPVSPATVAGGLLVLAGVFLVQRVSGSRKRHEQSAA